MNRSLSSPRLGQWNPAFFTLSIALGTVLFLSWCLPPTERIWEVFDTWVFRLFNHTLAEPGRWRDFVAIINWRPFDLVAAAVISLLLLSWLRRDRRAPLQEKLAWLVGFTVLVLLVKLFLEIGLNLIQYERLSPTAFFDDSVRWAREVKWIRSKDVSVTSFPSDHAFVLFSTMGFLWIHAGRRMGLLSMVVLAPFLTPRIIGGAHWTTDIFVGGLATAILLFGFAYGTPLARLLAQLIQIVFAKPFQMCVALGVRLGLWSDLDSDGPRSS